MTTEPSGEDGAAINPTHGSPEASPSNSGFTDSPVGRSQGQAPLPADVPAAEAAAAAAVADSPATSAEQDAAQDSFKTPTPQPESTPGDRDQDAAAPSAGQETTEEVTVLLPGRDSGTLQMSVSLQDQSYDRPVQEARETQSLGAFPRQSPNGDKTPQVKSISNDELESAAPGPQAEVQPTQDAELPPTTNDADKSPVGAQSPPQATSAEAIEETAEGPKALGPDTEALPSDEPQVVTWEDVEDGSREPQTPAYSLSPEGSLPLVPGPETAPGRRPLDPNLYMADEENNYMRSMTSLLGGGEGSISSLADILVWSETMGMGTAMGFLASDHSTVADVLHSTGPVLRSVSSILGSASSAFSSGLASGTGSALRSVTQVLETVERRTAEGIRSAVRYLTSHLTPRRSHAGPSCD
nr:uncharacterized protein C2orf57 homolog [Microcebus murinus]